MSVAAGISLMDTGIRMRTQGRFVLFSSGSVEALGLSCPCCSELAVRILPFARCKKCRDYLFQVEPPTEFPREYKVDWITGTVTAEEEAPWPEPSSTTVIADPEIVTVSSTLIMLSATTPIV